MPITWDEYNNTNNVHKVATWPTPLMAAGRLRMAQLEAARQALDLKLSIWGAIARLRSLEVDGRTNRLVKEDAES